MSYSQRMRSRSKALDSSIPEVRERYDHTRVGSSQQGGVQIRSWKLRGGKCNQDKKWSSLCVRESVGIQGGFGQIAQKGGGCAALRQLGGR